MGPTLGDEWPERGSPRVGLRHVRMCPAREGVAEEEGPYGGPPLGGEWPERGSPRVGRKKGK